MRIKAYWGYPLTVALPLVIASLIALFEPTPIPRLRDIVFDTYQRWHASPRDPDSPVRIVAIDEASLAKIGQWPWPRDLMARLNRKLWEAGAAAISYDILFSEPDQSSPDLFVDKLPRGSERTALEKALPAPSRSHDDMFADALGQSASVLGFIGAEAGPSFDSKSGLAVAGDDATLYAPYFPASTSPLASLFKASKGAGAINWIPDGDNVIRKVPTVVAIGNKLAPSLALETVRVALGASTIVIRSANAGGAATLGSENGINAIKVGDRVIDTEPNGEIRLIARKSDPSAWISAASVLDGSFNPDDVKGCIVLVGAVAIGLSDQRSTPVDFATPGVEIHAQAVEQILTGASLLRPDWMRGVEAALIAILGSLLAWILRRTRNLPSVSALAGLCIPIIIAGWSWILFVRENLLFDAVVPSIGILAVFLAATLYHFQEAEIRRAEVRVVFGRFVTPAVAERLVEAPHRLVLGGEIRELTIMFSDVRNFTGLVELQPPEGVVSLIRRIHTPATEAVLRHDGTLDKFIGDGMMAFWNAPLDTPDHATLACRAALDIAAMARNFRDPEIEIGIGLHTGEACVGNLGSEQRLEYSALGDAVNLASRVEQLTKLYGVEIIATEETAKAAVGLPFLEIDRVTVRGRHSAIGLFTLHTSTVDESFSRLKDIQKQVLAAYRDGDFRGALSILRHHAGSYADQYQRLFSHYEKSFEALIEHPRAGWRGINQL